MIQAGKILFNSVVLPFYRENAGVFIFLFTMMFLIVNKVDGAGLLEYHYSLIVGTLRSSVILSLVFFSWLLYARKFVSYISAVLCKPEYAYLQILNCLGKAIRFRLFFVLECLLFLPVLLYAMAIVVIGLRLQLFLPTVLIIGFLLLICLTATFLHLGLLHNPNKDKNYQWETIKQFNKFHSFYSFIVLGFVANYQKLPWLGIKIVTCGVLYLITRNNTLTDYDTKPAFLFFSFCILANSILVFRIREFEETYLAFYRGVPVTLLKRFSQYCLVYSVLLVPEFITLSLLVPIQLHPSDALRFSLCGYSLIMLLNSITFAQDFSMKEYLKIIFLFFFIQYILLLSFGLIASFLLFSVVAVFVFWAGYFRFERFS